MLAGYYPAAIYGLDCSLLAEATAQKLCFIDSKDIEEWVSVYWSKSEQALNVVAIFARDNE